MSQPSDILYWLAAIRCEGIGAITLKKGLDFFGNIKTLFHATSYDLAAAGYTAKQIAALKKPNWKDAEKDWDWCKKNRCQIILSSQEAYPTLLKEIYDAPAVLFVCGNAQLLCQPQIAVVGTRNPTTMGAQLAENFSHQLASAGLIITSGLALGVDAASHRGALRAKGGTIAVCGNGLGHVYPSSHRALANEIKETGALISEFPPDTFPKAIHFPMRNRIISGLSLGVLVVEAAVRSGSLITARLATEQGRDVFALPGSIHNPLAKGCHQLIREGAKLIETAEDILQEIHNLKSTLITPLPLTIRDELKGLPLRVFEQIGYEITSLDAIIIRSGLTAVEVSSMLLSLELEGYVRSGVGGYVRTP